MLSTAALCVAIGVYPPLLYGILPFGGAGYQPYNISTLLTTTLILGTAALTFFTVGRKYLTPHETRLRDFDVGYVALGRGLMVFADILQRAFAGVYRGITDRVMPRVTKIAGEMQTGLLGVNGMFMLATLLILLLLIAIWRL